MAQRAGGWCNVISESVVALSMGLGHVVPPTQYKAYMPFSAVFLSEGSTYFEIHLQRAADFMVWVYMYVPLIDCQRSIKMAFSYDLFVIVIIIILSLFRQNFSSGRFSLK